MQQNNNIPSISKDSEVFDFEKYKNGKKDVFSVSEHVDSIFKTYTVVNSGKYYKEFYENSFFAISKSYYSNNNIKSKGISFNYHSFRKGIWYFYKEDGSFSHEIDYDTSYKFTWKDIMQYCKDNSIILEKGHGKGGWITTINRTEFPAKPLWIIEHYILGADGKIETITLDGITGKEIDRKYSELPGE